MPSTPPTQQMGEKHEVFLAEEVFGGTRSRASGSQWTDPGDGRNNHAEPLAFAWDGKSTRGEGLTITLKMIAKIREQALSERPAIGLRWYANDLLDLVTEDWVAMPARDQAELLELASRLISLESVHGPLELKLATLRNQATDAAERADEAIVQLNGAVRTREGMARDLIAAQQRAASAEQRAADAEERYRQLSEAASNGRIVPPPVPMLPWTLVYQVHLPGHVETSGMHFGADGTMTPFRVSTVRVERALAGVMVPQPDGSERRADGLPRLIVNDLLVPEGDLYVDGVLHTRASKSNPALAVG